MPKVALCSRLGTLSVLWAATTRAASLMPTCDDLRSVNSVCYVRNNGFFFHLTSYLLAISDYMGPVCGLLYGRYVVYIDNLLPAVCSALAMPHPLNSTVK